MAISLHIANIVIIAETHNPSILTEEWLAKHGIIEDGKIKIRTREISVVHSDIVEMVADPQRVQFSAMELNEKGLKHCVSAARLYFKTLPHIPYKAFGFNFHYLVEEVDPTESVEIFIKGEDLKKEILPLVSKNGFISHWSEMEANCRVTLEPKGNKGPELMFNFHYELDDTVMDKVDVGLSNHVSFFKRSRELAQKIAGG